MTLQIILLPRANLSFQGECDAVEEACDLDDDCQACQNATDNNGDGCPDVGETFTCPEAAAYLCCASGETCSDNELLTAACDRDDDCLACKDGMDDGGDACPSLQENSTCPEIVTSACCSVGEACSDNELLMSYLSESTVLCQL